MNIPGKISKNHQAPPVPNVIPGGTQTVVIPEHLEEHHSGFVDYIKWGAIGLLVLGGTALVVRHYWVKKRSNKENDKAIDAYAPATKAKKLMMAFVNDGWPGTDEEAIRKIFMGLKDRQEYDAIIDSYKRIYDRNLNADLESELTSTEYNEMVYILATKPGQPKGAPVVTPYEAWAQRLDSAMSVYYMGMIPGTDEDAIYQVFNEIPNYSAYLQVAAEYKKIHGTDLYADLCGDMWASEVDALIKKVKVKH